MKKRWYHWFMFWKKKRYVVLLCYQGQAEYFSTLKFAKTHAQAKEIASDLLYNTIGWQTLIYRWNPFYKRVEHFDSEHNTFPPADKIAIERLNADKLRAARYSSGIISDVKATGEKRDENS